MPKILVLYHYYRPDDVVSAVHYADLCEGLTARGYDVEIWPSNRSCHTDAKFPARSEVLNGVTVRRVWRPAFSQHSFLGRILNAIWMQKTWAWRLLVSPSLKPEIILTGTDPIFSVGISTLLKCLRPKAKIAHWCFDLYPEAAIADGVVGENNPLVKLLRLGLKRAYQKCDLIADLGPCMRSRLERYPSKARATLTPWALEEPRKPLPPDLTERQELFGESKLGLLYSGSLGRAHDFYLTVKLARLLRDDSIFCYAARGSRMADLKKAVNPEDRNIRFAAFAPPEKLAARLSAPDVHIVSLRPEWTGVAIPSKFFGALAIGRPVLFEGSPESSIAKWIEEYKVGWVLRPDNLHEISEKILRFSGNSNEKAAMFDRCHEVYQNHFSRKSVMDGWDRELRKLLQEK